MSREIPYSPMGKPKRVSQERMREILAKHAPKAEQSGSEQEKGATSDSVCKTSSSSELKTAEPKPRATLKRMKWRTSKRIVVHKDGSRETVEDENTIESDAGYAVMRCTTNGVPTVPLRFLAFKVCPEWRLVLGHFPTGEAARSKCEEHRALSLQAA